jgi:hypothetical protein
MRRVLIPVLSVFVTCGLCSLAHAADADVKAILDKAIKAHGGEEALTKYKASQSKNKGKITLPGLGETEFTQETSTMLPDKFKEMLELDIGGQKVSVTTVVNGDKVYIKANGNEVPINDNIKKALDDARFMMKSARLVSLLKDKDVELSTAGEDKVEGKPTLRILVKAKGQKDVSLFFDKETGLLAKVERRTTDGNTGNEITEERIILEYSKPGKEGLSMPKKVLVKHDGDKFLEAEVLESKPLEKLDDSEFDKP